MALSIRFFISHDFEVGPIKMYIYNWCLELSEDV